MGALRSDRDRYEEKTGARALRRGERPIRQPTARKRYLSVASPAIQRARSSQRLVFAHASCLCLGLALIMWSVAPALIERVLTGHAPHAQTLAIGSASLLVGLTFLGLHVLIRRAVRWALWAAFGTALAIATAGVTAAMASGSSTPSLFSLILACATVVTTWRALHERRS